MYPKEGSTHKGKNTKHNTTSPNKKAATEKKIVKNPPGVELPPETEMSPAQYG